MLCNILCVLHLFNDASQTIDYDLTKKLWYKDEHERRNRDILITLNWEVEHSYFVLYQ